MAVEETFSEQLIVRLDEPCHPSTRLAKTALLRGWFLAPANLTVEEIENAFCLDVLCESASARNHPERSECELSAAAVPREVSPGQVYLEEIKLTMDDELGGARRIRVKGIVNIESLIPQSEQSANRAYLTLIVSHRDYVSLSNTVEILVQPRSKWDEPYGGFLFPRTSEVRSDFLVLEGWALKKNAKVERVELSLNGKSIGEARSRLWNSEISLALPDPIDSYRGVFNKVLKRDLFGWLPLSAEVVAEARVFFEDETELCFSSQPFIWGARERERLDQEFVRGEIETVKQLPDGRQQLAGWCIYDSCERPTFIVSGVKRSRALLGDIPNCEVEWTERDDIVSRFPERATTREVGFSLKLPAHIVGATPGQIRLYVGLESKLGKLVPLGPAASWNRWSALVEKANAGEKLSRKILSSIVRVCSSFGARVPAVRVGRDMSEQASKETVMFATHNLSSVEGAPQVLRQVVDEYIARTNKPENVLVVSSLAGELRSHFENQGAKVVVLGELSAVGQSFERYQKGLNKVSALAKTHGVTTIYANVIDSFWAVDLALRTSTRSIWAIHECVDPYSQFKEFPALLRARFLRVLSEAPEFIFVSQVSANKLAEFTAGARVHLVPNGLDVDSIDKVKSLLGRAEAREALSIDANEKVISIIGVTAEHKGQDVFIREMSDLVSKHKNENYRFFVVGARNGEYIDKLKEDAALAGLEGKLSFVEETPEVARFYRSSDVIVVASRAESCPLVPLEAFAFEVPVVSTMSQGLAEQIRDQENALVFSEENKGALSKAVERCFQDAELRSRLVENAYRDVQERYRVESSLDGHIQVIRGFSPIK